MIAKRKKTWDRIVIGAFLSVPILASIISTIHIVHLFNLGNPSWMSVFLAITFEVGSIASFMALSVLAKIKKGMVWFIFVVLFLMQLIGNVYFSFEYVNNQLSVTGSWLANFVELMKPICNFEEFSTYKFLLAILIGTPIPMVSLAFLKSLVDYLKVDDDESLGVVNQIVNNHSGLSEKVEPENLSNDAKDIAPQDKAPHFDAATEEVQDEVETHPPDSTQHFDVAEDVQSEQTPILPENVIDLKGNRTAEEMAQMRRFFEDDDETALYQNPNNP
jgi:hypothetical protein